MATFIVNQDVTTTTPTVEVTLSADKPLPIGRHTFRLIVVDDSGDDNANAGAYVGDRVTGLDMPATGAIVFDTQDDVTIQLGAQADAPALLRQRQQRLAPFEFGLGDVPLGILARQLDVGPHHRSGGPCRHRGETAVRAYAARGGGSRGRARAVRGDPRGPADRRACRTPPPRSRDPRARRALRGVNHQDGVETKIDHGRWTLDRQNASAAVYCQLQSPLWGSTVSFTLG